MTKPENCGTTFCSCIECVNDDGPEWYLKQVDEQSAFEDWLARVCPSGDVESVQYQWEHSSDYAAWLDSQQPAPDRREGLDAHHVYCRVVTEDV